MNSDSLWSGTYDMTGPTQKGFVGFMLQMVVFPLAFVLGGSAGLQATKLDDGGSGGLAAAVGTHALLGASFATMGARAWNSPFGAGGNLLQCGFLWCVQGSGHENAKWHGVGAKMGPYKAVFGAAVVICAWVWAAFHAALLVRALVRRSRSASAVKATDYEPLCDAEGQPAAARSARGVRRRSWVSEVAWAALPFGLLAFLALCCVLLGNGWQHMTADQISASAKTRIAPGTAEPANALFRTRSYRVGAYVLNAYPDVLIYYIFLASVALVATLARRFRRVERVLGKRFAVLTSSGGAPQWWWRLQAPPWSVSVGGLLALAMWAAMIACLVKYWGSTHYYQAQPASKSGKSHVEIAARTLGQVANATMGLLLFPVAKNSLLTSSFGVAWEQVLVVHIWLGALFMILGGCHMLLWWKVYSEYHVYPDDEIYSPSLDGAGRSIWVHDIFAVKMFYPCNAAPGKCSSTPHADNFTIPAMVLAFGAMLVALVGFARHSVRRANFELFYYVHHVYLALFAATLWHAGSAWYYVVGGLALWLLDRLLRAARRSQAWETVSLDDVGATTSRLELRPRDGGALPVGLHLKKGDACDRPIFEYQCGQYFFLNVPQIARWEWHPFTISSAPSSGRVTAHIKQAPGGVATFTGQLHQLALDREKRLDLHVNVDGPYGEWFDKTKYSNVALVVGGIGVTPAASIFRELYLQCLDDDSDACDVVDIVWTVAACCVVDPFVDVLLPAVEDDLGGKFKVSVYVDQEQLQGRTHHKGIPVAQGRPNYADLVADLAHANVDEAKANKDPNRVSHLFACGPPGMAAICNTLCLKHDVSYHAEVFAY